MVVQSMKLKGCESIPACVCVCVRGSRIEFHHHRPNKGSGRNNLDIVRSDLGKVWSFRLSKIAILVTTNMRILRLRNGQRCNEDVMTKSKLFLSEPLAKQNDFRSINITHYQMVKNYTHVNAYKYLAIIIHLRRETIR